MDAVKKRCLIMDLSMLMRGFQTQQLMIQIYSLAENF